MNNLGLILSNGFKKDIYRIEKRGKNLQKLWKAVSLIIENNAIPSFYRNHKLIGIYEGRWELHIESDWLLIYKKENNSVILECTGTHADLF